MSEKDADAKKIWEWLREPDWRDDDVPLDWLIEWVNRRPIAEASRVLCPED